jgi:hypothetical protein
VGLNARCMVETLYAENALRQSKEQNPLTAIPHVRICPVAFYSRKAVGLLHGEAFDRNSGVSVSACPTESSILR